MGSRKVRPRASHGSGCAKMLYAAQAVAWSTLMASGNDGKQRRYSMAKVVNFFKSRETTRVMERLGQESRQRMAALKVLRTTRAKMENFKVAQVWRSWSEDRIDRRVRKARARSAFRTMQEENTGI